MAQVPLERLDRWLEQVCAAEEGRAVALAGDQAGGWAGIRNLTHPSVSQLLFEGREEPPPLIDPAWTALVELQATFGLERAEAEVLLVLLAPHVEPRYRALYGVLQDDLQQPQPTERLLMVVLGSTPERQRLLRSSLAPGGRLNGAGLVLLPEGSWAPLGQPLLLPPEVRMALLGFPPPQELHGAAVEWTEGPGSLGAPMVVAHGAGDWRELLARRSGGGWGLVSLPDELEAAKKLSFALWRAAALQGKVAALDAGALEDRTLRELGGLLLDRGRRLGGAPIFLVTRNGLPLPVPHLEAQVPGFRERKEAWLAVAAARAQPLAEEVAERLAAAWRLSGVGIEQVFEAVEEVEEAALSRAAGRIAQVPVPHGLRIEPERSLDEVVVRDTTRASLERLVYFARQRDRMAEKEGMDRQFRLRKGPIVLFSGRSGTGKTLAAEGVAKALGRPLVVVELSRLVSKYIGETEKHIDQVLSAGERAGVVLFFDEADALFSQRTEVSSSNDRYANLEVGYLLQRIERHDGLVILATNLRHSIDEAFLRRFQFRVEFPFPEPEDRRKIWQKMLAHVPHSAVDYDVLIRHRMAGGDIKNAALKAIFLAEQEGVPLTGQYLERAVALEMLELGRLSRKELDLPADRGVLLKELVDELEDALEAWLRARFLKEIHIIHGSPTKEVLAGRKPAISLALYRVIAPRTGPALRTGFVISAWSHRPEEENELLGVVYDAVLFGPPLAPVSGKKVALRVQESYDFDFLQRFWSSHGHPVRASVVLEGEVG